MTKEVLEFIAEYKLNPQHFFNANGQTLTTEIKGQMRSQEKIFAFDTSTCGNGHNINPAAQSLPTLSNQHNKSCLRMKFSSKILAINSIFSK